MVATGLSGLVTFSALARGYSCRGLHSLGLSQLPSSVSERLPGRFGKGSRRGAGHVFLALRRTFGRGCGLRC